METRLVEDSSAFGQLEPFWNRFVVQSSAIMPFDVEWFVQCWKHFDVGRRLLQL